MSYKNIVLRSRTQLPAGDCHRTCSVAFDMGWRLCCQVEAEQGVKEQEMKEREKEKELEQEKARELEAQRQQAQAANEAAGADAQVCSCSSHAKSLASAADQNSSF